MKITKSCANCAKSRPIPLTSDVLCKTKGVISSDYVCIHHKLIPNYCSFKDLNYKCKDCINFVITEKSSRTNQTIGVCRLFSVRCFDGNKKKACSKFTMSYEFKSAILNSIS
jgi:hypothetical protein